MKKIIALIAALTAAPAFATAVCAGANQAATVPVAAGTTPNGFILNAFDMKCSANVFLDYEATDVIVAVGSGSKKGKNLFAGSSAGGAVAPAGACADQTVGCTATETATAAQTALDAAGTGTGT